MRPIIKPIAASVLAIFALGGFAKAMRGPKWSESDYRDLLCLLFSLARLQKQKGNLGLEAHNGDAASGDAEQRLPPAANGAAPSSERARPSPRFQARRPSMISAALIGSR
jgi:flagellar motor component MotA